jgi:hypothetical protein
MATITIRQYNSESGALLGNVSVLSYGRVTSGTKSSVIVLDIAFTDLTNVGNIKLGLISSGGLTVNASPTGIDNTDGSASNGNFGVRYSSAFDSSIAAGPLNRHFAGLNSTVTAGDSNNVSIPNRSDTLSDYIYLDIQVDSSSVGAGSGSYKIFFDYS